MQLGTLSVIQYIQVELACFMCMYVVSEDTVSL